MLKISICLNKTFTGCDNHEFEIECFFIAKFSGANGQKGPQRMSIGVCVYMCLREKNIWIINISLIHLKKVSVFSAQTSRWYPCTFFRLQRNIHVWDFDRDAVNIAWFCVCAMNIYNLYNTPPLFFILSSRSISYYPHQSVWWQLQAFQWWRTK